MSEGQRNILILIAIVVVVAFVGTAQAVANSLSMIVGVVFTLLMCLAAFQWYRRNETSIMAMKLLPRLVLQGSLAGILFVLVTGTIFPAWGTAGGAGTYAFFGLIALFGLGIYWSWQQRTLRW